MRELEFVQNHKGELILISSLKKELKRENIKLTKNKLKQLGYKIVKLRPIAFL